MPNGTYERIKKFYDTLPLNSHHEYIHDGRKYHQDINISFIALELKLKLKFIHGHFNLSESHSIALTRKTITLDISDSPTDLKVSEKTKPLHRG